MDTQRSFLLRRNIGVPSVRESSTDTPALDENFQMPDRIAPQDMRNISARSGEINDLQYVRGDLCFPVTMDESRFVEILYPRSQEDLEKYLPWRYLVRDISQPSPKIVKDTSEELNRINSSSRKDFDPIRQQRYWQNQIFLKKGRRGRNI